MISAILEIEPYLVLMTGGRGACFSKVQFTACFVQKLGQLRTPFGEWTMFVDLPRILLKSSKNDLAVHIVAVKHAGAHQDQRVETGNDGSSLWRIGSLLHPCVGCLTHLQLSFFFRHDPFEIP